MVLVQKLAIFQFFYFSQNWVFPKGLVHGFGLKLAIFPSFYVRQYRPGKCFLRYSRRKNAFLGYKNKKFEKSKNSDFSKGVSAWFWSKNWLFFNFFILANIGQENVFYDVLEGKNAVLGYKSKKFKKSKNWDFSKGVRPWFWSQNGHFSIFLF